MGQSDIIRPDSRFTPPGRDLSYKFLCNGSKCRGAVILQRSKKAVLPFLRLALKLETAFLSLPLLASIVRIIALDKPCAGLFILVNSHSITLHSIAGAAGSENEFPKFLGKNGVPTCWHGHVSQVPAITLTNLNKYAFELALVATDLFHVFFYFCKFLHTFRRFFLPFFI